VKREGHTEAVRIHFDPKQISYEELLDAYFNGHRCGARNANSQYRSVIWHHNPTQKFAAEQMRADRGLGSEVAISAARSWHDAEERHQKYYITHAWVPR